MTSSGSSSRHIIPAGLAIGLVLFADEMVLKEGTMQGSWFPEVLFILLSSLAFGFLIELLTSFTKRTKVNRVARAIIVILITLIFIVNYFVYKMFKVFYDLRTIFSGAGGALGEFKSLIVGMIFSPSGAIHLGLFLLIALIYCLLIQRFERDGRMTFKHFGALIIALICALGLNIGGICTQSTYRAALLERYSFQTAVNDFGLLTGLSLDVAHLFGGTSSFTINDGTASNESSEPEEVTYPENKLDINFSKLAESSSGVTKEMDEYVASLSATHQNEYTGLFKGKNLIMITAEAFSGDIIDKNLTPTLYRLANKGIQFKDYYQPASAGTTGGEYEIVFGGLPTTGGSSFKNMAGRNNYMTMGSQLNRLGYYGQAFHNNTYTFYDRDKTHVCLGYSQGFMGMGNGMEKYVTEQWPESDLEMMKGTIPLYIDQDHFNIYYMSVSGHNGYSYDDNAMTRKHWDQVKDLKYSDRVKSYIAAQLELEDALTYLLDQLEEKNLLDDTVIVLSADHFPYGLDDDAAVGNMPYLSELYGYNVTNYMQRDHNTLIMWSGSLEDQDPIVVDTPVSSLDILPTLSNLFGTEYDSRLFVGRDVFSEAEPLVFNTNYDWKTDKGTYYAWTNTFEPNDGVKVDDNYVDRINQIVKNKMTYCQDYQAVDYFQHVFGNAKTTSSAATADTSTSKSSSKSSSTTKSKS